jgi:hypothetical protein
MGLSTQNDFSLLAYNIFFSFMPKAKWQRNRLWHPFLCFCLCAYFVKKGKKAKEGEKGETSRSYVDQEGS